MTTQEKQSPYIEAEAGMLLGKKYEGMKPIKIPQASSSSVEELAKEHGVFIPKLNSLIHESDIDPDMAQATTMKNYVVFENATDIPWISDLLKMKPAHDVLGVRYTDPIDLPDFPTGEFRWVRSAVSSLGCLYVLDNWKKILHCVNLLTGQRSRTGPFEAESFVACYQDNVYVGTNGMDSLRMIKSEELYEKIEEESEEGGAAVSRISEYDVPIGKFVSIKCPRINQNYGFHACTESCPSTGLVIFLDESLSFIEYDLIRQKYCVYKNDKSLTRIISTTGITTTEYKMFATSNFLKRKMYGVTSVWSEKFIASLKWPIMLMIPSMREPDVVSKAVFIDSNGYIYYNGKCTTLSSPIRPIDYQGMIRIHRDVFIVLDVDALVWKAMRIVVQ